MAPRDTKGNGSLFSRYEYYQSLPKTNFDAVLLKYKQPCIRISGPYESEETKNYRERTNNKNHWISSTDFNTVVARAKDSKLFKCFEVKDSYNPISTHKFRMPNKKKWIAGDFLA